MYLGVRNVGRQVLDGEPGGDRRVSFSTNDFSKILKEMKTGKSPGYDHLSIEYLQSAGPHLPRLLSVLFNLCIGRSYLPTNMAKSIVVPILKNKTGDICDRTNYIPISLAIIVAKSTCLPF